MVSKLFSYISSMRFIPHLIVYYLSPSARRSMLDYERDRWLNKNRFHKKGTRGFLLLLNCFPEYRTLFYLRTHAAWLSTFAKGQTNLFFHTPENKIGKGLVIWHGFSTIINAQSIGDNCEIWHNVTVGKKTTDDINDKPIIGSGVRLCTGAIVIGDITIGNNATIAAGAVTLNDVQDGQLVAGVPALEKKTHFTAI